jgi:hypothetical protein
MLIGKVGKVEDMTAMYLSDAKNVLEKAILVCGFIVQREAMILLNKTKGSPGVHSKAGQVPFFQSGELKKWISVEGARYKKLLPMQ